MPSDDDLQAPSPSAIVPEDVTTGAPGGSAPPEPAPPPLGLAPPAAAMDELVPPPLIYPVSSGQTPHPLPVPSFLAGPPAEPVLPVLTAPPRPRVRASLPFLVFVAFLSLAADLATKTWAKERLSGYDPKAHGLRKIELLKGHVDFIFAQNPGGAWSFLRSLPDTLRRPFFLVVSAAAIVFIINIYLRVYRDQSTMKWGLPLALGGAMGNLADRIRFGWVVDFIDVSMKWGGHEHHWPTFNVADIAIVVGVGLMAIDMLRSRGLHIHDDHGHGAIGHEGAGPSAPAAGLTPSR